MRRFRNFNDLETAAIMFFVVATGILIWPIMELAQWSDIDSLSIPTSFVGAYGTIGIAIFGFALTIPIFNLFNGRYQKLKRIRVLLSVVGRDAEQAMEPRLRALAILDESGWLYDGSLRNADLCKADLNNAILSRANLEGVRLQEANITFANLAEANLTATNLREADLTGANLRQADLTDAKLWETNLRETNLQDANLTVTDLRGANLTGANLQNADFTSASMVEADLSDANMQRADLSYADLCMANLSGADLREANLVNADLRKANLRHSDLSGANFTGARYDHFTRWPENFDPRAVGAMMIDGRTAILMDCYVGA